MQRLFQSIQTLVEPHDFTGKTTTSLRLAQKSVKCLVWIVQKLALHEKDINPSQSHTQSPSTDVHSGDKRLSKSNTLTLFISPCHKPRLLSLYTQSLFIGLPTEQQAFGVDDIIANKLLRRLERLSSEETTKLAYPRVAPVFLVLRLIHFYDSRGSDQVTSARNSEIHRSRW